MPVSMMEGSWMKFKESAVNPREGKMISLCAKNIRCFFTLRLSIGYFLRDLLTSPKMISVCFLKKEKNNSSSIEVHFTFSNIHLFKHIPICMFPYVWASVLVYVHVCVCIVYERGLHKCACIYVGGRVCTRPTSIGLPLRTLLSLLPPAGAALSFPHLL